jgi:tetratricopeptide (TPR) repeat protein
MLRSRPSMRLGTVTIIAFATLVALDGGGRRAGAESAADGSTSEGRTAAAREHFDRGNSYFESAQYDNAIKEFEASYAIKPVPLLLFDIGNVARVSGKNEMAIEYFRRYLRTAPAGSKERTEARRFLADLTRPGYKAPPTAAAPAPVESAPPPAAVAPAPTPAPAAAVAVSPAPAPAADKQPVYKKWWLWTIVGVAVVGVGVGVGLGLGLPKDYTVPSVAGSVGTIRF